MTQNTGFINENELIEALDNKRFRNIDNKVKINLLDKICKHSLSDSDIIICRKPKQIDNVATKPDIEIIIRGISYHISIKKGSGNSVHQEPLEQFIKFCLNDIDLSRDDANKIRFFIWGDGTFNNSGKIYDRMSANDIKKKYPQVIDGIQDIFDKNKAKLIDRIVKQGAGKNNPPASHIFYGTKDKGIIRNIDSIIKYLKYSTLKPLSVGGLTFQAWNRNLNGGTRSENKRGHIQLKWGKLEKDLTLIDE